jgi:hypothetical protein
MRLNVIFEESVAILVKGPRGFFVSTRKTDPTSVFRMVLPRAVASLAALYLASASSGALSLVQMRAGPAARWESAHGVQVAHCETAAGNLRVFVEHWHGAGQTASASDSIEIQVTAGDEISVATVAASGTLPNTDLSSLPGCAIGTLRTDAGCGGANNHDNWAYWDFTPNSCGIPTTVKLLKGNSVVFEESCGDLYPVELSVSEDFGCVKPTPAPTTSPMDGDPSASGDPHMKNMLGDSFDIFRVGEAGFVRAPRSAEWNEAGLSVRGYIKNFAVDEFECSKELYITRANVSGSWVGNDIVFQMTGNLTHGTMSVLVGGVVQQPTLKATNLASSRQGHAQLFLPEQGKATVQIGAVSIHIHQGLDHKGGFLNVKAHGMDSLDCEVGGILGLDSHSFFSSRPEACKMKPSFRTTMSQMPRFLASA